jgi:hypothetical protein
MKKIVARSLKESQNAIIIKTTEKSALGSLIHDQKQGDHP